MKAISRAAPGTPVVTVYSTMRLWRWSSNVFSGSCLAKANVLKRSVAACNCPGPCPWIGRCLMARADHDQMSSRWLKPPPAIP